jgi:hypothetical protein
VQLVAAGEQLRVYFEGVELWRGVVREREREVGEWALKQRLGRFEDVARLGALLFWEGLLGLFGIGFAGV